jgi:large subunit ribosomal protein L25
VPEGVALGGTFEVVLSTLTVRASVESIPDKIVVDVSKLGLGDSLHVRDIQPPGKLCYIRQPRGGGSGSLRARSGRDTH